MKFYEDLLNKEQESNQGNEMPRAVSNTRPKDAGVPEREIYEALCRGEYELVRVGGFVLFVAGGSNGVGRGGSEVKWAPSGGDGVVCEFMPWEGKAAPGAFHAVSAAFCIAGLLFDVATSPNYFKKPG